MSTPAPTDSDTDNKLVELPDRETAFTARKDAFHSGTNAIYKFRSNWHSAKGSVDNENFLCQPIYPGVSRVFSATMQSYFQGMNGLSEAVVAALALLKSQGTAATDEECEDQIEEQLTKLFSKPPPENERQLFTRLGNGADDLFSNRELGERYFTSNYALNSELDSFIFDVNTKTLKEDDYDAVMNNHSTRARILAERFVKTSHEFITKLKEKDPFYKYMS